MHRIARITLICGYEPCQKSFPVLPSQHEQGRQYCTYACAMLARPRLTLAEKFWPKVRVAGPDECWTWTAGLLGQSGYGSLNATPERRGTTGAHVVSWFLHTGSWPTQGFYVLHSCDQPSCVNPAHLWLGTQTDNMQDCIRKGRNGMVTSPTTALKGIHTWTKSHSIRPQIRGDQNGMRLHPEAVLRGDKHPGTKLTEAQWAEALTLYATGQWRYVDLARRYGVSTIRISQKMRQHKASKQHEM